jgi:hypothetical protein
MIEIDGRSCVVKTLSWKLYFDGSMCSKGQGFGCCIISPSGACFYICDTELVKGNHIEDHTQMKERWALHDRDSGLVGLGNSVDRHINKSVDWRLALVEYLCNPKGATDRRLHRQALKYILVDDELYRRTMDGLLLKCLN